MSSISLDPEYANVEGSDGAIDYGASHRKRTIRVPFEIEARDLLDFPLLRDVTFRLVTGKESFYIREMRRLNPLSYAFVDTTEQPKMKEKTENVFVGGKRYLVRLQNSYELEQMTSHGSGEFVFVTTELPYAESIGTTQILELNKINVNDEIWGHGMGLSAIDETLSYTHNSLNFCIYNAGDIPVHPFLQDFKLKFSDVLGSTSFLQLENKRNGTVFRVNESVASSDVIEVDGPVVTINKLHAFRKTNRKFIELSPGRNDFVLTGVSSAKVEFDFRFYYL